MSGTHSRRSAARAFSNVHRAEPPKPRQEEMNAAGLYDENLPVRGRANPEGMLPATPIPLGEVGSPSCTGPRPLARPVSLKARMIRGRGCQPENSEWMEVLTSPVENSRRRRARDPMLIRPEVLTSAGHPPSRTREITSRLGDEAIDPEIRGYRDLRRHCLDFCAEGTAEVRYCAVINCPLWPYRLGRNPHNRRRGKNPFKNGGERRPKEKADERSPTAGGDLSNIAESDVAPSES